MALPCQSLRYAAQTGLAPSARKSHPLIRVFTPCCLRRCASAHAKGRSRGSKRSVGSTRTPRGLLLLSDDGQFIHRMSSPKKHVPKVYQVTTKHPLDERQIAALLEGVVLDDDPKPVRAACVFGGGEPSAIVDPH